MAEQKNTLMAVLCYLGLLIIVPFLTDAKNDPFVKYHIKQGLVLLIANFIAGILWSFFIGIFVSVFLFVLMIIGIMNAVQGNMKPLPLIGGMAEKFKF